MTKCDLRCFLVLAEILPTIRYVPSCGSNIVVVVVVVVVAVAVVLDIETVVRMEAAVSPVEAAPPSLACPASCMCPTDFFRIAIDAIRECDGTRRTLAISLSPSSSGHDNDNNGDRSRRSPRVARSTLRLIDIKSNAVCTVIDAAELCRLGARVTRIRGPERVHRQPPR